MDATNLIDTAPLPILITNTEGVITQVNAAAEAFYGCSATELIGTNIANLAYAESRHEQERALWRVLHTEQAWDGLLDYITHEGRPRTVHLYLSRVRDQAGAVCGVAFFISDVNEMVGFQRTLQRERDRLEAILESANDAMFMVDSDGTVVTANLQFERLFNLHRYAVLEHPLDTLVDQLRAQPNLPPDLANVLLNFGSDRSQSASYEFEISSTPRRVIRWYSEPVHTYDGVLLGRLFVFRDATHELAVDRTKTEFVSLVTHELGTPLSVIKNAIEMIQDDQASALSEDGHEYVQIIQQRVELLETLIKDIIALTRIEAGRIELRCAYYPLNIALDEAINSLRSITQARHQTLEIELADNLPPLWIDRNRIAQVFTNLLTNASKYTHDGGVLLVRAARVDHLWELPEDSPAEVRLPAVLIMVQDTGIGIAPEEQARIFQRFYRAENARQRRIQGSGLGLTIVESFVELHGGKVWLRSAPMQGSAFFFTIPIIEGK